MKKLYNLFKKYPITIAFLVWCLLLVKAKYDTEVNHEFEVKRHDKILRKLDSLINTIDSVKNAQ